MGKIHQPKLLYIIYAVVIVTFVVYSYSQVDLNLTLSPNSLYQEFQRQLTQLGYYNRPLSATLFLILTAGLYGLYFGALVRSYKNKLQLKHIQVLIGLTALLVLAYPAFSHDIFNYMFDARIVTKYGLDPHFFKALDFAGDPWTRFMHWTHRYYPYGPGWLILTLVPSYLGLGKFVATLALFKITFLGFHLANCYLIYKITKKLYKGNGIFALTFYGLNPLVLIESILSLHNEVMMLTLALISVYLFFRQQNFGATVALIISITIKYLSAVILPLYLIIPQGRVSLVIRAAFYLWLAALIPIIFQRALYSWYFIPLVGLAAIAGRERIIQTLAVALSAASVSIYWPYLLYGDYQPAAVLLQQRALWVTFTITAFIYLWLWEKRPQLSS